jgi:hypothetical protein
VPGGHVCTPGSRGLGATCPPVKDLMCGPVAALNRKYSGATTRDVNLLLAGTLLLSKRHIHQELDDHNSWAPWCRIARQWASVLSSPFAAPVLQRHRSQLPKNFCSPFRIYRGNKLFPSRAPPLKEKIIFLGPRPWRGMTVDASLKESFLWRLNRAY